MRKKKKQGDQWEYFDDCAICQAMKRADEAGKKLSGKELTEAFQEANEQQRRKKRRI